MFKLLKRLFKTKRNVKVNCTNGVIVLEADRNDIIYVPWWAISRGCPFHLESDGTVTLRLEGAAGYGKTYPGITWTELDDSHS